MSSWKMDLLIILNPDAEKIMEFWWKYRFVFVSHLILTGDSSLALSFFSIIDNYFLCFFLFHNGYLFSITLGCSSISSCNIYSSSWRNLIIISKVCLDICGTAVAEAVRAEAQVEFGWCRTVGGWNVFFLP